MGNGSNNRSKVSPYTGLWVSDECWPLNPCFPQFPVSCAWQTIYFLNLCDNPINFKLFSLKSTFSYFVLYLDNATSYGYHVVDFLTPYNKRSNMTCITTKLEHFEFSDAWRGSHCHHWRQWRSQGLPGWATHPPGGPKWGRKWIKVWGKIRKLNWDLRKKWGKWNSCPPGTVRLVTALTGGGLCILFTLYLWNFIISASQGIFLDKAHKNNRII